MPWKQSFSRRACSKRDLEQIKEREELMKERLAKRKKLEEEKKKEEEVCRVVLLGCFGVARR